VTFSFFLPFNNLEKATFVPQSHISRNVDSLFYTTKLNLFI